jgi:hypothetical protein
MNGGRLHGTLLVEGGDDLGCAAHPDDVATAGLVSTHADDSGSHRKHH